MGHIGTLAVNQYIFPKLPYDPIQDFTPITLIAKVPSLYVVHPDLPVKNLKEFIAYVKANEDIALIRAAAPGATYLEFEGSPGALQALKDGRADAFTQVVTHLYRAASQDAGYTLVGRFTTKPYHVFVKKGDIGTHAYLNKFLQNLRASVKIRYAEEIDYRDYEKQIQKMLNTYVQADEIIQVVEPVNIFEREAFEADRDVLTLSNAKKGEDGLVAFELVDEVAVGRVTRRHALERRHATALGVGTAYEVARTLRGDHDDVKIRARRYHAVVDVKAMRERQRRALFDVRMDFTVVNVTDVFIGQQHHHHVSRFDGIGDFSDLQAGLLGHLHHLERLGGVGGQRLFAEHVLAGLERLDLAKIGRLDFTTPDPHRFPALGIARKAVFAGGGAPIVLNGANEVAVAAFLQRRIGFLTIAQVAGEVLDDFLNSQPSAAGPASFEHVYDLDRWARARTIEKLRLAA